VHPINDDFKLEGIALGTIVVLAGYHLLRAISRRVTRPDGDGKVMSISGIPERRMGRAGHQGRSQP
jgi:hypothetical protein